MFPHSAGAYAGGNLATNRSATCLRFHPRIPRCAGIFHLPRGGHCFESLFARSPRARNTCGGRALVSPFMLDRAGRMLARWRSASAPPAFSARSPHLSRQPARLGLPAAEGRDRDWLAPLAAHPAALRPRISSSRCRNLVRHAGHHARVGCACSLSGNRQKRSAPLYRANNIGRALRRCLRVYLIGARLSGTGLPPLSISSPPRAVNERTPPRPAAAC